MCEPLMENAESYFKKKIDASQQEGMPEGGRKKQESLLKIIDCLTSSWKFTLEEACGIVDMTVEEYEEIKESLT